MKKGYRQAKEMNDEKALENAHNYRAMLMPKDIFPIIRYRTERGGNYGVLVNKGEKVTIWNAFTERLDHYHIHEYNERFISTI